MSENSRSSLVNGAPSCHFTPERIFHVTSIVPSGLTFHVPPATEGSSVASCGRSSSAKSRTVRWFWARSPAVSARSRTVPLTNPSMLYGSRKLPMVRTFGVTLPAFWAAPVPTWLPALGPQPATSEASVNHPMISRRLCGCTSSPPGVMEKHTSLPFFLNTERYDGFHEPAHRPLRPPGHFRAGCRVCALGSRREHFCSYPGHNADQPQAGDHHDQDRAHPAHPRAHLVRRRCGNGHH